jgi:threonine synthase
MPGIWKYQDTFGTDVDPSQIYLGEGDTALVWDTFQGKSISYKLEYQNPSGSYKDRATAVLAAELVSRGIKEAVEHSSGNAGASFAAYAARSNIRANIYVPASASGPKRRQIEMYGANLIPVDGPRSEAARQVREAADCGMAYASHAYLPFGMLGIATIAYELLEQVDGQIGTVIAPVGHGSLFLGIIRGFQALYAAGLLEEMPYMVGVQAANCSPVYNAYSHLDQANVNEPTIAEGVRVVAPVRGSAILDQLTINNGKIVAIGEESILSSRSQMAARGIYVEPTSALVWSALKQEFDTVVEPVILICSGSGYKYSSQ